MAKQVWQSNSGKIFDTQVEAEKEDCMYTVHCFVRNDSIGITRFILNQPLDKVDELLNALCELKKHNEYMQATKC